MACYLIDLDGTVYCGGQPVPHAAQFIQRLNRLGRPYRFLTNAPERSPRYVEKVLRSMGVPAEKGSVVSVGVLAVEYLAARRPADRPLRVALLGNRYMKKLASRKGLELTWDHPDWVLVSFGEEITIGEITRACILIQQGAAYIATNPDPVIPREGVLAPYTGAILEAIRWSTGKEPFMIGKPAGSLGSTFTALYGCGPEDIRVVGDRLDTDMAFAQNCGFTGWMMLTGSTGREEAEAHPECYSRLFASMEELADPNRMPDEAL